MDVDDARRLARELLDMHGLTHWRVVIDRAKKRAGICRFEQREIGLSGPLTKIHTIDDVRDTILHEIAHALVGPRHGHDAVWRAKAVAIGGSGTRAMTADSPQLEGAWVGTCAAGHVVHRHRRPTRVAACQVCSPRFETRNIFVWRHHGETVAMHPRYVSELSAVLRRPEPVRAVAAGIGVGTTVRVLATGRYAGLVGVVEKLGRTRYHVRIRRGVLTVPFGLVEPVDASGR